MRGIILATLFTSGALAMTADAQDKKDPPKKADKPADDPWTERVTVKRYAGQTDLEFLNPHENVKAYRKTLKAGEVIVLATGVGGTPGGSPKPKTEITDAAGNVYRVTKVGANTEEYWCYVTKIKDAPKKPE